MITKGELITDNHRLAHRVRIMEQIQKAQEVKEQLTDIDYAQKFYELYINSLKKKL